MNRRELLFLASGVVLSYVLFFAVVPLVSAIVNGYFYGGEQLYRLTWSHYVLPAAGAVATVLVVGWLQKEVNWPRSLKHQCVFIFAALLFLFFGFVLGVQAYSYTFILYGASSLDLPTLWYFFLFTPFWALVPGVVSGWLASLLLHCKTIKKGTS